MRTQVIEVTPELAEQYLAKNESNRHLSRLRVASYADDMKNGRWKFNPNPIVFDVDGKLADGQHRLAAIIKAGIPVKMLVMFDAPIESKDIIDFGKPRTSGDVLKIDGYPDAVNVSATIKKILAFDAGKQSILSGSSGRGWGSAAMNFAGATKKEVVDYARANYDKVLKLVTAAHSIHQKSLIKLLSPSEIAFLLYAMTPYESGLNFLSCVISGIGLAENTPELAFRRIIERARVKKDLPITASELTKYALLAFEKYKKGEKCEFLRLPKDKK